MSSCGSNSFLTNNGGYNANSSFSGLLPCVHHYWLPSSHAYLIERNSRILRTTRWKVPLWCNGFFLSMVAYFCAPILLNGASILAKWLGYETAGQWPFTLRYWTLLAIPVCLIIFNSIATSIINRRTRNITKPPSNQPPSKEVPHGINANFI